MSVNPAKNNLEDRLVDMISDLQRQVLDLRNRQKVDATSIATAYANGYIFGPITIAAGSRGFFNITTTPNIPTLTIWNFEFTVYVDSNGLSVYAYPGGALLTGGKQNMRMSVWSDWENSNDAAGIRNNKIMIENTDSVAHDYYLRFGVISPQLPVN